MLCVACCVLHVARRTSHVDVACCTSHVACGLCSPFHRNVFVSCSSDARVRIHSMLIPEPVLSLEPSTGTAGLPTRMGYHGAWGGWDTVPDGIPCRMGYRAGWDTVSHGIPCRMGYCAGWDPLDVEPGPWVRKFRTRLCHICTGAGARPAWRTSAPGLGLAPDNGHRRRHAVRGSTVIAVARTGDVRSSGPVC
jgi:hypothetical protein